MTITPFDQRHIWTKDQKEFLLEEYRKQPEGTSVDATARVIVNDFNMLFATKLGWKTIASKIHYLLAPPKKGAKTTPVAPPTEKFEFILVAPSVTGNGDRYEYAKDQFELQAVYARLINTLGKAPDSVRVYRHIPVTFKVSLDIGGVADAHIG